MITRNRFALSVLSVISVLSLVGCKESKPSQPAPTSGPAPTSKPASGATPATSTAPSSYLPLGPGMLPDNPMSQMSVSDKLSYAKEHFRSELGLVRKHPWGKVPSAEVQLAAQKVFGLLMTKESDGRLVFQAGVDFTGFTEAQVKQLVGNPTKRADQGGKIVWDYSYKGTEIGAHLTFSGGKVERIVSGSL